MKPAHTAFVAGALLLGACQSKSTENNKEPAQNKTAKAESAKPAAKDKESATKTTPEKTKSKKPAQEQVQAKGPFPESTDPAMKDPSKLIAKAPNEFHIKLETTAGDVTFKCVRAWAPHGADRIFNLARIGFYNDVSLFRAVKGFVVQFGIHGNPEVAAKWRKANLAVDPVKESNRKGTLTYAMAGSPTTRTTQLFVNLKDNKRLDAMGFAPVCEVSKGMENIDKIYMDYGGRPSSQQGLIQTQGNSFLRKTYPKLDYIKTVSVLDAPKK